MKIVITESQQEKMKSIIQDLIDGALNELREMSDDWGLGEMDEIDELEAIDKIVVNDVHMGKPIVVDIDIHVNRNRYDFDNITAHVEDYVMSWFPGVEFSGYEIIDEREFGPGIDW
jgi:hypothetical protein